MDGITIDIRGICFKMILVEGGNYVIGATPVQHGDAWENEFPVHAVELDGYYIGQTTVTQALWNVVMGLNEDNPSDPTPMVGKSWNEWQTFLMKLNELTERQFRMPTEAEWEIAARGGNEGKGFRYAGSNHLNDVAWFDLNSGETEVTQELYMAVMGYNPSKIVGDNYPVNCVSWDDCFNFCMELRKITGQRFRIPTEAEWEYAARGGSKSKGYRFSGSNNLDEVSWNIGNSDSTAHPVKMKRPNELGVYDMTGNAWEICHDLYAKYEGYDETNPRGPQYSEKGGHVRRGGGWLNRGNYSRITYRYFTKFGQKNDFLSFRLAMEAK